MEKQIIRNHWTHRFLRPERVLPKCCTTPSLTVPDLSLTIDELLVRYERGLPLPSQKTPIYEDENIPSTGRSLSTMDLIDLHYVKKNYMQRLDILTNVVNEAKAKNAAEMEKRNLNRKQFDDYVENLMKGNKGDPSTNTP